MIQLQVDGSIAYKSAAETVPNLFVCENEPLERLLFNRRQLGLDFVHSCREASVLFLKHAANLIEPAFADISELMFLTKGYYYWLHNAFETAFRRSLPINFIGTNRTGISESGVSVKVHFSNLDAAGDTLLIGDTIASGSTICAGLEQYLQHHQSLKRVIVVSYAGTGVGAQRIYAFCKAHDVEVWFLYGLAVFGLAQNGFDLSFLHNQTVTSDRYLERARTVYEGKGISVAGWDFGSQAQAPRKYEALSRVEAHYWQLPHSPLFLPANGPINQSLIEKEKMAFSGRLPEVEGLE